MFVNVKTVPNRLQFPNRLRATKKNKNAPATPVHARSCPPFFAGRSRETGCHRPPFSQAQALAPRSFRARAPGQLGSSRRKNRTSSEVWFFPRPCSRESSCRPQFPNRGIRETGAAIGLARAGARKKQDLFQSPVSKSCFGGEGRQQLACLEQRREKNKTYSKVWFLSLVSGEGKEDR